MTDIIEKIKQRLDDLHDGADFSDVGNILGCVIGQHENEKLGFDLEDFESGFHHGVSVVKGTHG